MKNFGFVKFAAASPVLRIGDPEYNTTQIQQMIYQADAEKAAVVVFPELCITGYSCADLFGQQLLLDQAVQYLNRLMENTKTADIVSIVGIPLVVEQKLYNCAVAFQYGHILGVVPKMYPANYKEFYEKRWFTSGHAISKRVSEIILSGKTVPFGNIIFTSHAPAFSLGIEICEDLWVVVPPSSYMALRGATVIANLSASNELVSKSDYRRELVVQQSARCMAGYIYSAAGVHESTTDTVFGGDCIIAENGNVLGSTERFERDNTIVFVEIDVERLVTERVTNKTFADNYEFEAADKNYHTVSINYRSYNLDETDISRKFSPYPFIPDNPETKDRRCEEIFNIQVTGLAKRMEHTGMKHAVIGISGGLDSTLALLVTVRAFKLLGLPSENIIGITMPGFGTTDNTYSNAVKLMKSVNVSIRDIDIKPACLQHFSDIGHDAEKHDITYENVQARERTQILMDIANKTGGLVVGTGDLSELALGWSTYNGDHMSMYAVNCGVPKTLVKFLVRWVADNVFESGSKEVLYSIIDTPISPELLPPGADGRIKQKTEDVIGPYELHDFFLYYAVRCSMPPRKVLFLAKPAFGDKYNRGEIKKWLEGFYRRFFTQQFKRSCLPDGPKVGTIGLSPRGDWRMPSDAEVKLWLNELSTLD